MDSCTSHHKAYVDMCHLDMHQKSEFEFEFKLKPNKISPNPTKLNFT